MTLPGENPEDALAAVHHKAEYQDYVARSLASQWSSPIIVTTAVQFFEILASNRPGALRRFHELPRSMIYIDEVHSCLPTHLWRVTWSWIQELSRAWNCRWLLGSGSLPELWCVPRLVEHEGSAIPSIISPELSREMYQQEDERITLHSQERPSGIIHRLLIVLADATMLGFSVNSRRMASVDI